MGGLPIKSIIFWMLSVMQSTLSPPNCLCWLGRMGIVVLRLCCSLCPFSKIGSERFKGK